MKRLTQIFLTMLMMIQISSCNQCKKMECENGALCDNGHCLCEKWYSGEKCGLFFNRNYSGQYQGKIDSASRSEMGIININADSVIPNRLVLENGVYLEFENDSMLVIPTQLLALYNDTVPVLGSGTYLNDSLSFEYTNQYATRSILFRFSGIRIE